MAKTETRPSPRQDRSLAKRTLILEAAERLLATTTPTALTTTMVAKAAHVPIGSVYRYFANIDTLLRELFNGFNMQTLRAVEGLEIAHVGWRAGIRAVLEVVEDMHERHPAYGALMAHLGRMDDQEDGICVTLAARLRQARPTLSLAAAIDVAAMVVGIAEAAERRYHALPVSQRKNVMTEARRAIEAYLATYLDAETPSVLTA